MLDIHFVNNSDKIANEKYKVWVYIQYLKQLKKKKLQLITIPIFTYIVQYYYNITDKSKLRYRKAAMSSQINSEQQGFFTEQYKVQREAKHRKNSSVLSYVHHHHHLSYKLSPSYLPSSGIMRKQPTLAYNTCSLPQQKNLQGSQVKIKTQNNSQNKKNNLEIKQKKGHPYFLYARNQNYTLVYSRNEQKEGPIQNEQHFIKNQVMLKHVGNSNQSKFSKKIAQFPKINEIIKQDKSKTLLFDSHFECGNLHCVYKLNKKQQYILFIENDTNTFGYNQWFYFSVRNNNVDTQYTFRIINFKKKHSFFKFGCKPAVFSLNDANNNDSGWSKRGQNISYIESPIVVQNSQKFYCLSFSLRFANMNDYILIAPSLPYSYSRMVRFISEIQSEVKNQKTSQGRNKTKLQIQQVSKSICGNLVPQLTITSVENPPKEQEQKPPTKKKMIIILARQHSGEVWSSYLMESMIRSLLSNIKNKENKEIQWLLERYIFKIYPMVNVDGVIYGNSRCDITGSDLNRQWKHTSSLLHPQVYHIKRKIANYSRQYEIELCYDLHGHSKNYNIFAYSCQDNIYTCRILPYIINKVNPIFYMPSCTFGISRYKQSTARANIYKLIKTQNVLTIETSYYGSKVGGNQVNQFTPEKLQEIATDIIKASKLFLDRTNPKSIYNQALQQIKDNIQQYKKYDEINEGDSGSDSDPQADEININVKIKQIFDSSVQAIIKVAKKKKSGKKSVLQVSLNVSQQKPKQIKSRYSVMNLGNQFISNKVQSKTLQPNTRSKYNVSTLQRIQKKKEEIDHNFDKLNKKNLKKNSFGEQNRRQSFRQRYHKLSFNNSRFLNSNKQMSSDEQFKERNISLNNIHEDRQETIEGADFKKTLFPRFGESPDIIQNRIKNVNKSDQFVRKFERFIPISMNSRNKSNTRIYDELISNEDQSELINVLFENKKKLQLQRIRRDVLRSTKVVERQGKLKLNKQSSYAEDIVNFKSFKQNQKINRQIRKLTKYNNLRYL